MFEELQEYGIIQPIKEGDYQIKADHSSNKILISCIFKKVKPSDILRLFNMVIYKYQNTTWQISICINRINFYISCIWYKRNADNKWPSQINWIWQGRKRESICINISSFANWSWFHRSLQDKIHPYESTHNLKYGIFDYTNFYVH